MENKIEENVFKIVRQLDSWSNEKVFPTVQMEIDSYASLNDVINAFECFLKASGYHFPENSFLDFVEE
jgi:hypothetical protein